MKKAPFRRACSILQKKKDWWDYLSTKIQLCTDVGDYRGFYEALKAVSIRSRVPCVVQTDTIVSVTTPPSLLAGPSTSKPSFSANRTVQGTVIDRVPQLPLKGELDEPPTLEELTDAIEQLKSRKAAGVDGILPEIWKHGVRRSMRSLTTFLSVAGSRASCHKIFATASLYLCTRSRV